MHGHTHNDPIVAMPLYRLMTWLDPQFVRGWTMGGMILARDHSPDGTARSLAYLREGWAANPLSVDIPSQIGYTIAFRKGNRQDAIGFLEAARRIGYPRRKELDDDEMEGLRTAYHVLALCYRDARDAARMRQVLAEWMSVFPSDPLAPRLMAEALGIGAPTKKP